MPIQLSTVAFACLLLVLNVSSAFQFNNQLLPCRTRTSMHLKSAIQDEQHLHPAVEGWPAKYSEAGGNSHQNIESDVGPRILSKEFDVHEATDDELRNLDVRHWPTWSTKDKEKWAVGNQIVDKEMPYGELSYVLSGKLEIIPQSTGVPVVVEAGDFVTFPRGFVSSWKVLEEIDWHYYLY